MPKIDQPTILNALLPVPPLDIQQKIVDETREELDRIDRLAGQLTGTMAQSRSLRTALLRHAFSGKLVPQDPADEPASELLARIQAERDAQAAQGKPKRARRAPVARKADGESPPRTAAAPATATPPAPEAGTPLPPTAVQQEFEL
jgi:type I restriction enzyme S subunit